MQHYNRSILEACTLLNTCELIVAYAVNNLLLHIFRCGPSGIQYSCIRYVTVKKCKYLHFLLMNSISLEGFVKLGAKTNYSKFSISIFQVITLCSLVILVTS